MPAKRLPVECRCCGETDKDLLVIDVRRWSGYDRMCRECKSAEGKLYNRTAFAQQTSRYLRTLPSYQEYAKQRRKKYLSNQENRQKKYDKQSEYRKTPEGRAKHKEYQKNSERKRQLAKQRTAEEIGSGLQ